MSMRPSTENHSRLVNQQLILTGSFPGSFGCSDGTEPLAKRDPIEKSVALSPPSCRLILMSAPTTTAHQHQAREHLAPRRREGRDLRHPHSHYGRPHRSRHPPKRAKPLMASRPRRGGGRGGTQLPQRCPQNAAPRPLSAPARPSRAPAQSPSPPHNAPSPPSRAPADGAGATAARSSHSAAAKNSAPRPLSTPAQPSRAPAQSPSPPYNAPSPS